MKLLSVNATLRRRIAAGVFSILFTIPVWSTPSFTLFESGQVRPLALAADGKTLFAVNTPDNRLEIFQVHGHSLKHIDSVPVGMEPVAVAVRNNNEVWVVNHLSDSVSIVNVRNKGYRRVVQTLLVGDEPRDIVFAGPNKSRAFITTAHRGQNTGFDPQLTTPGIGRADIWVFEAGNLGHTLGGVPLTVLTLFTDTPRGRWRPHPMVPLFMPPASIPATKPPPSTSSLSKKASPPLQPVSIQGLYPMGL